MSNPISLSGMFCPNMPASPHASMCLSPIYDHINIDVVPMMQFTRGDLVGSWSVVMFPPSAMLLLQVKVKLWERY